MTASGAASRPTRPSGEVAFLFTDLQGSTSAWERDPVAMNEVLQRHDDALGRAILAHHGAVFSVSGDAFGAAFHTVDEAADCAIAAQLELAHQEWPSGLAPRVRMGLHVGSAFERDGNYFGPTPNRAARIMAAAHGGQILLSDEAATRLTTREGATVQPLGRFQLRDLAEPIDIHQLVVPSLPRTFPALSAAAQTPRVHAPPSSFVGRDAELSTLISLLDTASLVTLVAAGGTGKSRLAVELAAAVGHRFADGALAVELADGDEHDVVPRLAEQALGNDAAARTEGGADLLSTVARHLADRQVLLIVDNCEHVLAAVAGAVNTILDTCPGVRVVATSRERLAVPHETVLLLEPLSTEHAPGAPSPAATLFVDRARSANPFTITDDKAAPQADMAAVEAICAAVEGSPLGIELAAARTRTLTVRQIAERLTDDLSLLRARAGHTSERHRSLDAAIAWSYQLLGDDERRLLAWSSVFVGGFELSGADAVGEAAGLSDVVDLVESLVEKSLLTARQVGAHMRYRSPEPIRQFASARLDETGERTAAVDAHFRFCRTAARQSVDVLDGHVDPPLFTSLAAELDNHLAAIQRAVVRGERKGAMSLASSLDLYWAETGHVGTAIQVLDSLARHDPDHSDTSLVHVPLLWVATMAGELPRAQEIRDLMKAQMDAGVLNPIAIGGATFGFGFVESASGDGMAAAREWSLAARGAEKFVPALARQAYWSAGQSATAAGDHQLALGLYTAADRLDGPTPGWWPPFVDTMRRVARTYQGEDHVEALHAGATALEDSGLKMRFVLASAFVSLAMFHADAPARADHWWRRSMGTAREVGNLWACWVMLECAAWSAMERGDDDLAAQLWHAIDAFAEQRGYGQWPVVRDESAARRQVVQARSPETIARRATAAPWSLTQAIDAALQP